MPIYAYRCDSCGVQRDFLRKMSDPPMTDCPECGQPTLKKMLTAAGFQLKGSGWYATDFRNNGAAGKPDPASKEEGGGGDQTAKAGDKAVEKPGADGAAGAQADTGKTSESTKPADSKAPSTGKAPSTTPATAPTPSTGSSSGTGAST